MILYHFEEILITNIAFVFFSSVEVVFNRNEIYLTKDDIIQDRKDPTGISYLSILR
jgi:hypothetical protein